MPRADDKAAAFAIEPDPYEPDAIELPPCPDVQLGARQFEIVDAKLWFGRFTESGRLARKADGSPDYEIRRYNSRDQVRRQITRLREANDALPKSRRLREGLDWWQYGTDFVPSLGAGLTGQYLPLMPGPSTRQQYWADYFATSAKAFEAYHHDPLAHRAINLMWQFVLGRGVEAKVKGDRGQQVWDDFWKRNKMDQRLKEIGRDLSIFGEQFLRYFPTPAGLVVRSLDPASIYEVVSDQEDWETVYFYHQQAQMRTELYAPPQRDEAPTGPTTGGVTKFVIRQIPAEEIDHVRINVTSGEVRGRSDLFAALGYIKRLRDYMTSRVVKADMESRFVYKLVVDGDAGDIDRVRRALFPKNAPPEPGTVLGINKATDLDAFAFDHGQSVTSGDPLADTLINLIAVAIGVAKEYLGIQGRGSRATALVATEGPAKLFDDRQDLMEGILLRMAERVFEDAGCSGDDADIEFTFPSIVGEDRSKKLEDLAFAESMDWVSKRTAADTAGKELDISSFDFDEEQQEIAEEFAHAGDEDAQGDGKVRRPMIAQKFQQTPKLDVTRSAPQFEDEGTGVLVPTGDDTAAAGVSSRAGFPGDENPASSEGAANIRHDQQMKEAAALRALVQDVIAAGAAGELDAHTVTTVLREAARSARGPRRRPDDPTFREHADAYHEGSAENLKALRAALTTES